MDIGTGIAIAGIWLSVGLCGLSKTVAALGWLLLIVIAVILTMYLL